MAQVFKMTRVVSTKSNAPFKRYVRANRGKIGLVADVSDATRFNNRSESARVLARVHSVLPSCYFEYEELVPPDDDERNPLLSQATTRQRYRSGRVPVENRAACRAVPKTASSL
jgi:hypothetical protein